MAWQALIEALEESPQMDTDVLVRVPLLGRRSLAPVVGAGSDRLRRRGVAPQTQMEIGDVVYC